MRGDRIALALVVTALLLFALAIAGAFRSDLVEWSSVQVELRVLNALSLVVAAFGFGWSLVRDWRWLRHEEADIDFVLEQAHDRVDLVLLPPSERRKALKTTYPAYEGDTSSQKIETLLDDRVLRVLRVESLGGAQQVAFNEGELRAIAQSRSAGIGSCARYLASLLLLLTVLGTFLGIKAALPDLIGALGMTTSSAAGGASPAVKAMANALEGVAAAFGSNLNALLGAMALGLVTFGLATGRQNTLARLEQVSSLYVYSRIRRRASGDGFTAALRDLSEASQNIAGVSSHLEGLGDSIRDLSTTVQTSLDGTRQTLQEILRQQHGQVIEESRQTVEKVERQITEAAISVQHATALYAGLVGTLSERSDALSQSNMEVKRAADELKQARERFGQYADSTVRTVDSRLARLEELSLLQAELMERTKGEFENIATGVKTLVDETRRLAMGIGEAEERRRVALHELDQRVASAVAARFGEAMQQLDGTLRSLPSALTASLRESGSVDRPSSSSRVGPASDPSLARLVDVLESLRDDLSRPLWRKVFQIRGFNGRPRR